MKVLITSHFNGSNSFSQQVVETQCATVEQFFCEFNQMEYPLAVDRFTVVNEHGVFINDPTECCESYMRIYDGAVATPQDAEEAITMSGEVCKQRRKNKGWTQERLARAAGISLLTVARFENRHGHETRQSTIKKIDAALRSAN